MTNCEAPPNSMTTGEVLACTQRWDVGSSSPPGHVSRLAVLFPVPFAIRERAFAGGACAAVLGRTWLCHHFFATQFALS